MLYYIKQNKIIGSPYLPSLFIGAMLLSGSSDGLIAVSSPMTGMTVRVITDHKGVAISNIDVTPTKVACTTLI